MKKPINAIGTLSVCFLFCFTSLKAQVRDAILTGKVGPEVSSIVVDIPAHYGLIAVSDTIKPAPDGTFKHNIKIKSPQAVYLHYGEHPTVTLWLKPGSRLPIDLRNKTPEFKGADAIFSEYYIGDHDFWNKTYADYQKRNPHFDKGDNQHTDKYFVIQDSITNARRDFLKNYFPSRANKDVQEFIKQQNLSFLYMDLYYKLTFNGSDIEKFKFYQNKYNIKRTDFQVLSDKVEFKNTSLLSIEYYREFFCMAVGEIARKQIKQQGETFSFNTYIDHCISVIDELTAGANTNIELKAIFLNSIVWEVKATRSLEKANKINSAILAIPAWEAYASVKIVKEKYGEIIRDTKFNKGNQAPDFAFKDVAGKTYGLNDFKGKKIYIDMGASWCGPCIATIPAWNKLVEANKGNENVVFISLSLDDKEAEWKTFLGKYVISGMPLYAGGGFKGIFATNYNIFAIPHFMLIDEDGKILAYAAPSPDDEEILPFLQKNKPGK